MTTLKERLGQEPEGAGEGGQGAPDSEQQPRWRRAFGGVWGLVRRHLIFSITLAVAVLPRLLAMLGYQPAVLFRMDTFDYIWGATHLSPNVINPSGYSLFLWLLRPFHSFVLVVTLQHLMGLGIGVMVYALLRRYGLPAWGATLAATPVLFDPAQILIEQFIMSDLLAMVLMVIAFTLLLIRKQPSLWRIVTASLLMGASATVRPTTLPLILFVPVYLLVQRVGWRRAAAALVAGALPVLGYMGWFDAAHGSFNMSDSNGLFLWSRTMTFADCGVIKLPPDLVALCPDKQLGKRLRLPAGERPLPKYYLWNRATWEWQYVPQQFVPDSGAFTQANNARALRFALMAIKAQPLAYARVVWDETIQPFTHADALRFPVNKRPDASYLGPGNTAYATAAVEDYGGYTPALVRLKRHHYGTELHPPFVYVMNMYQQVVHLPGFALGLLVLAGLAGILIPRRRTAAGVLLWVSAVTIMVLPTAEHEYTYRYVIVAVPLACLAAALAFRKSAAVKPPAVQPGTVQPAAAPPPAAVQPETDPREK